MLSKIGQICFALFFLRGVDWAKSFSLHGQPTCSSGLSPTKLGASGSVSETEADGGKGVKLEFKGDFQVASDPLPNLPDDKMASFFENPEYRNLLVTAGGKRSCEEVRPTESILDDWKKACGVVGAESPTESDVVLSVNTGGIDLPGLRLVSKALIGVKLLQVPSPRYEFTLIGDERTVTGLAPVVWVFNKLTGAGDNNKKDSSTSTSSLSVIGYDRSQDGKITITADANISITVRFPSALLRILPTSKEKAEETGGKAITKTIQKDVQASVKAFQAEYLKFVA